MRRFGLFLVVTVVLVATGCGDDGDTPTTGAPASTAAPSTTTAPDTVADVDVDPAAVPTLTGQEVCDLVDPETVSAIIDLPVTQARPGPADGTPQCAYPFDAGGGTIGSITTSVQRPEEDLQGNAGSDGFEFATSFVIFDSPYEDLPGVGDRAMVTQPSELTQVVVLAGAQVLTVVGVDPVTVDHLGEIGNALAEAVPQP